jgi:hypothetical protein
MASHGAMCLVSVASIASVRSTKASCASVVPITCLLRAGMLATLSA